MMKPLSVVGALIVSGVVAVGSVGAEPAGTGLDEAPASTTAAFVDGAATSVDPPGRAPEEDPGNGMKTVAAYPREIAAVFTGERATVNDHVDLPRRGSETIEVRSEFGAPPIELGMPDNLRRAPAGLATAEAVSFDAIDLSFDVTAESLEGGARALLTIRNANAPTEYRFAIDSNAAISLVPAPSGGVEVVDEYGEAIAYVEAPWAIDASGQEVETRFHLEGQTLIQTVEHGGATYPVVADPAVQSDCGIATCTIRFDRARTHFIGHSGQPVGSIASAVCVMATGPAAGVCIAVINAVGWAVSANARDYYNNGNCYGIRYPKNFPVPVPPPHSTQVNRGTYNCN